MAKETALRRHIIHPFEPVVSKDCRILILGSVPSVRSVEEGFFYMHPRNRFWPLMGELLGADLTCLPPSKRRAFLLSRGIALYDAIFECDIVGSSDSRIENTVPADIPGLILGTSISAIFCNGIKAYESLTVYHPCLKPIACKLPSTSPANASYSLTRLAAEWQVILRCRI